MPSKWLTFHDYKLSNEAEGRLTVATRELASTPRPVGPR